MTDRRTPAGSTSSTARNHILNSSCNRSTVSSSSPSPKPPRNAPIYAALGPIRRLLFTLVVFGLLNYFLMLWKLSWESVIGIVSKDYDNFFTSKKTGINIEKNGEATPYFDLPEELKSMVTGMETSSIMTVEPMSTNINHERTGENSVVLPQTSSMITIKRLGDSVSGSFRDVSVSHKTEILIQKRSQIKNI